MKTTITRKKLLKLAFKALDKHPVNSRDRGHLLYAACTMPAVALAHKIDGN